jgi:zinc transporter ZupT
LWFAAGAMIWMVVSELLPDAYAWAPKSTIATIITVWIAGMILFQGLIG